MVVLKYPLSKSKMSSFLVQKVSTISPKCQWILWVWTTLTVQNVPVCDAERVKGEKRGQQALVIWCGGFTTESPACCTKIGKSVGLHEKVNRFKTLTHNALHIIEFHGLVRQWESWNIRWVPTYYSRSDDRIDKIKRRGYRTFRVRCSFWYGN